MPILWMPKANSAAIIVQGAQSRPVGPSLVTGDIHR